MFTRLFYIAIALLLVACGNSGGGTQVAAGHSGGLSLPFAATTLPNTSDIKATLLCPNGVSVDMKINAKDNTVLGSCQGLTAGSKETFTITFTYGSANIVLAYASKSLDVAGNTTQSLSFSASDYTKPDTDKDGYTNLYEIANGMNPSLANYKIGVTVTGLNGSLVLDNGGDQLTMTSDGTSHFAVGPVDQASYDVVIATSPTGQECTLGVNSSGTVNAGDVDIAVTCVSVYHIKGSVVGLAGAGLVLQDTLQDTSTDPLALSADGLFTFATPVAAGGSYSVSVLTQPTNPSQTCAFGGSDPSLASGSGVTADVNDISLTCTTDTFTLGGQVEVIGLLGSGLVLQNAVPGSPTDSYRVNAAGSFTFGAAITDLSSYAVTVTGQPTNPTQLCTVDSGATGQINGGNVNTVHVKCDNVYTISGTISGLSGSGMVLQNDAGERLNINNSSSSFAFTTQYFAGDSYSVSVASNPKALSQTCTVTSNLPPKISQSDVTNIQITCTTNTYSISGKVSGLAAGNAIELQDNGTDNISMSADGSFTFATPIVDGGLYNVTFLSAPTDQPCTSTYGSGKINGAKVNHVNVFCGPKTFWHTTFGSLAVAREFHTMTQLPDGRVLVIGGFNGKVLDSVELYDPIDDSWKNMPTMNVARMHHAATLLADGTVLVTGGMDGTNAILNTAEIFNFSTNKWTTLTNLMTAQREYHTATLLANGQVLIAGGTADGSTPLATAELYDPAWQTNPAVQTWTNTSNNLSVARYQHTETLLASGQVLVVGGTDGAGQLASAELYDPVSDTWASAGSMGTPRDLHTATLLPNGKVLIAGGYQTPNSLSTAELYDPNNATTPWSAAKGMATAHANHTATLLANGKVLVAGSSDALGNAVATSEIYDPTANTWTAAADMVTARGWSTAALLPSGEVLVAGGYNVTDGYLASGEGYSNHAWTITTDMNSVRESHTAILLSDGNVLVADGIDANGITSSAEIFNPLNHSWTSVANTGVARVQHSMTLLADGEVLVAGVGNTVSGALSSAERYNPATQSWTPTLKDMANPRSLHTATLLNDGRILVTGGATSTAASVATAELYNPATDEWLPTASMKDARIAHTATLLTDGRVLVVGGSLYGTSLASAELYDPVTETWSDAGKLKTARGYHTATLMPDGQVLVVGGSTSAGYPTAEKYNPATNSWSDAGTLLTERNGSTATLLASGRVMIVGGHGVVSNVNGVLLARAELYDPALNRWVAAGVLVSPPGLVPIVSYRYDHTATRLLNGQVLVCGGVGLSSTLANCQLY